MSISTRSFTFAHTRAASRANIVHHVSNTRCELSKLRISLSLSVLTRSNFLIKMSLELGNQSISHCRNSNTFSSSNLSNGLAGHQFSFQFFSRHTKSLRSSLNWSTLTAAWAVSFGARSSIRRCAIRRCAIRRCAIRQGDRSSFCQGGRIAFNCDRCVICLRAGEAGNTESKTGDKATGETRDHACGDDALLQVRFLLHRILLIVGGRGALLTEPTFAVVPMNHPRKE